MRTIGRYELVEELGRGCMGVVHLARDPKLRRQAAIKTYFLPEGVSGETAREYRERFLREARAAAGISHPGIVTVYDADEDPGDGTPYIAMEYVPGRCLREIFRESLPMEPDVVVALGGSVAVALDAAHRAGIVHRDVKPANVLVREGDGAVKIADFGVARLATSELTRTGATLGSPAYMSPEQVRGGTVDGRSDLFSLAVILYEALCGEKPFTGDDLPALAYSICHETPIPVSRRCEGLSPAADRFFDRALAKDPADRFRDGEEFREGLTGLREELAAPSQESTSAEGTVVAVDAPDVPSTKATIQDSAHTAARDRHRRIPVSRWIGAVAAFLAVLGIWVVVAGEDATLQVKGKSGVDSGTLTLFVDGKEVHSRELRAEGRKLKRMVKKYVKGGYEEFDFDMELSPGRHELVAEVIEDDGASLHRETVTLELEEGQTTYVRLTAGGVLGTPLSLKVD